MLLPDTLAAKEFLAIYWQRRALALPAAIKTELPSITGDELGWLATQDDVESRIVFSEKRKSKTRYRVEHGPFESVFLEQLPEKNWTLLVQDVDKHLPDFRLWFDLVPFIPSWRIDDLMVSFAAPGGSVGPHQDNYDVFLCQGDGVREWRLGDHQTAAVDSSSTDLALLHEFETTETYRCSDRDVLYVPPGVPHWGIADECCVTYSIGMRAPSGAELYAGAERIFGTNSEIRADHSLSTFYSDRDLQADEAMEKGISNRAIERLREQEVLSASLATNQLAMILGSVVTDPKSWLDPESPTEENLQSVLPTSSDLIVHGMARLTAFSHGGEHFAFLNGEARSINRQCADFFEKATHRRQVEQQDINQLRKAETGNEFLTWMCTHGAFDLVGTPE